MKISCVELDCQHPIGPHVHILVPDSDEAVTCMLEIFGVPGPTVAEIKALRALATKDHPAIKCDVFPARRNNSDPACEIFIITQMLIVEGREEIGLRLVIMKVDREFGMPGIRVAELFKKSMYGNRGN